MGEVAVLMLRVQQCDPSNCSPLFLDHCLLGLKTSRPMPTPTQWKDTQNVACRVSATMLWATTEADKQPIVAILNCIFNLNQLLEDILDNSLYVYALDQELDVIIALR